MNSNNSTLAIRSLLVVDDSAVQRAFAVDLCRQIGVPLIHEASDGQTAMDVLQRLETLPDVVILDLEMPGVDGVELAERMHAADLLVSLVIISARDQSVIDAVARLVEALGFPILGALQKPLKRESLQPVLEAFEA